MIAKSTTTMCAILPPRSSPKRLMIQSAPVIALLLRIQIAKNTITKIWFQVGHNQGSQVALTRTQITTPHKKPYHSHQTKG